MAERGSIHVKNLITVISVAILVGTEVFGTALAAGWAIAGLFQLGDTAGYVMMAALSALGLWGMVLFMRRAIEIEPIRR